MLEVFPPSSLDNSILTSVLVGVLVVWVFQETLGWNFTGLVVPGYLASILVIQPDTGLVILGEAVLTWLVFTAVSDKVPVWWPWSPLFGRDRFFGVLLLSVAVRLLLEGGGFTFLQRTLGLEVDTELHSMSLVVVPLAANAIWRTGFVAAVTRIGVPVVVTWAILELVLLRFTNLSLASFELTYEDLALDFVSSPRAYILLLTGAWLGSAANLRWGWDYGGIIVPGLLSVCWLEPSRLAATLFEVALIAVVMRYLVRVPLLRGTNLTGGRPLVLAFCVGYALKFVLAWTLGSLWPGLQVRELFGFGYLLPTMIALRVIRAGDDVFRPIIPALVTSFGGFTVGSALGYLLAVALPPPIPAPTPWPVPDRPDVAMALHAWSNQGDVPDAALLLSRAHLGDATFGGGEGFGGLWIRPSGSSIVLTGRVGEPGLPAALAALARATDASAVLLCAPTGPSCESARRDLARTASVLRVEVGDRTALRISGRLTRQLETRSLAALVGPVALEPSGPDAVLLLDRASVARAASAGCGVEPRPIDPAVTALPLAPDRTLADPASQRLLAEELYGSWDAWRRREPWSEDALRVAGGLAGALGLDLTATGDRSVLTGRGFRVVLDRRGGDGLVHVPQTVAGGRTRDAARALWQALGVTALVEDAASDRDDSSYRADDAAQALVVGILARAGSDAPVVTVRALRDARDAGADLVLSNGRPVLGDALVPAFAELQRVGEALGASVEVYDGALERAWLGDAGNVARAAALASSDGETHVTAFLGAEVRRRLDGGAVLLDASPSDDLPRVSPFDLGALAGRGAEPPAGAWLPISAAAMAFAGSPDRVTLGELRDEAPGATLELLRDDILGVRWLRVTRCAPACEALYVPLGGRPASTLPEVGPDSVVTALALGAGAWVVR